MNLLLVLSVGFFHSAGACLVKLPHASILSLSLRSFSSSTLLFFSLHHFPQPDPPFTYAHIRYKGVRGYVCACVCARVRIYVCVCVCVSVCVFVQFISPVQPFCLPPSTSTHIVREKRIHREIWGKRDNKKREEKETKRKSGREDEKARERKGERKRGRGERREKERDRKRKRESRA